MGNSKQRPPGSEPSLEGDKVRFRPRFIEEADNHLRNRIRRYGELAELLVLILKSVDLTTLPILELTSDIKKIAQTTVELPSALHRTLREAAADRQTSMNTIVNSAIMEYAKKNK